MPALDHCQPSTMAPSRGESAYKPAPPHLACDVEAGNTPGSTLTDDLTWGDVFKRQAYLLFACVVFVLLMPSLLYERLASPSTRWYSAPNGTYPGDGDITYPLRDETVPTWALGLLVGLAAAIIVAAELLQAPAFQQSQKHAARTAVFLLIEFCIVQSITLAATTWIKMTVGRPRPDFLARLSTNDDRLLHQGRLSYPSGHASTSFATATFWALYFSWCFYQRRRSGPRSALIGWKADLVAFLQLLVVGVGPALATLTAVSRVTDYRHNPSDINAGCILGLVCSAFLWMRTLAVIRIDK